MSLRPRAAALRGDDYQHVIALYHACRVLTEAHLDSVSVEDSSGGAFDDIVVRVHPTSSHPHEYIQVKSSNANNTAIDSDWLLTAGSAGGKPPLEHFHRTWTRLRAAGEPFTLTLLSSRNFDHRDPVLALIDKATDMIGREKLDGLSPRTKAGQQLASWARALDINLCELKDFLSDVRFQHGESESSWLERSRALMRNAGLRDDDDALQRARTAVREWVKVGRGPRTRDDLRAEVAALDLLARRGTLTLAVHAIDHVHTPQQPNVTVDLVELYPPGDPQQRRQLSDPTDWDTAVPAALGQAREALSAFRRRRVYVTAAMRLPLYFAVGRTLSEVAGWTLSVDQRDQEWSSDAEGEPAGLVIRTHEISATDVNDLAVVVALSQDPTAEVRNYLSTTGPHVRRLIELTTTAAPGRRTVPSAGWALEWVAQARTAVRAAAQDVAAQRVHLFLAAPHGVAMFLGHQWNLVPTTVIYEHQNPGYAPTMTFAG